MFSTIRTQYTAITTGAANLYRRALKYTGIDDCPEMRITSAVAICVVLYYILCLAAWVTNLVHTSKSVTALISQ